MSAHGNESGPVGYATDGPGTPGERKETQKAGTEFGDRADRDHDAASPPPPAPLKLDIIPLKARDKEPLRTGWRRSAPMSDAEVSAHVAAGGNVGARLRDDQLVVDADPRNYWPGDDPLARLRRDVGLPDAPTVETGGGGIHIHLRKPPDAPVRGKLDEFPGLEFKTLGRMVVVPPSVHPNGTPYRWDPLCGPEMAAPDAPDALMARLRTPETASEASGGSWSVEQLSMALEGFDAREYGTNESWLPLAMAAHHATAGEGLDVFLEWCATDPAYAGRTDEVRRRWESFHHDRRGACTGATILWALNRDGRGDVADAVARFGEDPADDFPPFDEADLPPDAVDRIGRMNRDHSAVLEAGQFLVLKEDEDASFTPPRKVWTRMSRESFKGIFENERVGLVGSKREVSIADAWLQSPRRRTYHGTFMDPEGRADVGDRLNLWRGWAVEPRAGDWSLMRELIERTLCAGDRASSEYVMRWMAFMFQRPATLPETAIAFRGGQGTGKGTLGRALMAITGAHGMTVSSSQQFAGKFNSHLRNAVFVFADEAVWPGFKEPASILKQLVTEPVISFEGKGANIVQGRNFVHLMMASNNDWIVPAEADARRFAVFDVSENRQRDHAFFEELNAQMRGGGLEAMLHDLLATDLGRWRPSHDVPQTKALAAQKVLSLDPASRWWLGVLISETLPTTERETLGWEKGPVRLGAAAKQELVDDYQGFLRQNRLHGSASHRALVSAGKALGLETTNPSGKERTWTLPPLDEARRLFDQALGGGGTLFED